VLTWRSLADRSGPAIVALALAAAGCGDAEPQWTAPPAPVITDPAVIPVPIGRGPAYRPAARAPTRGCAAGPVHGRFRAHVELFAHRHAVVVPAGIGLEGPRTDELGRIDGARCRAAVRTLDPSGVVDFDRPDLTLDHLFATWGRPWGDRRMLSFTGPLAVYVGGRRATGTVPLTDGAQIVVELGGYVPPHRSFTFPPRR
jgi:hypothetical protein